jgi:sugar lactone lactonase YvrE
MVETHVIADGFGYPESTRWRNGRVWLCTWGAGEVVAVTTGGDREVIARVAASTIPFSIDWLPDGRLLIVDGPRRRLLTCRSGGELALMADLSELSAAPFNELVVTSAGSIYVSGCRLTR